IKFNSAFVFKYSPRPPALSSSFVDDVEEKTKKAWNNELLAVQKEISFEKNKAMIGTEQEVLVESQSRMSDKEYMGRTRNNTPCVFPADESVVGTIVRVKIQDASPYTLKGERINTDSGGTDQHG
ncbi:MAG: TRAM domain-containing protein, partial [Candidatus Omnitrophota bacterium]